jgi:hypothetical protein
MLATGTSQEEEVEINEIEMGDNFKIEGYGPEPGILSEEAQIPGGTIRLANPIQSVSPVVLKNPSRMLESMTDGCCLVSPGLRQSHAGRQAQQDVRSAPEV